MAINKPVTIDTTGELTEVIPITTSTGVPDASKLVQTNSSGKLDITLMPTGVVEDVQTITSSEALAAGDYINIFNNTGTLAVRKAIATDETKPANGYVLDSVGSSTPVAVYTFGHNSLVDPTGFTVADRGKPVFLSASTAGGATTTAPAASGNIVQLLGNIIDVGATVTINYHPNYYIKRA